MSKSYTPIVAPAFARDPKFVAKIPIFPVVWQKCGGRIRKNKVDLETAAQCIAAGCWESPENIQRAVKRGLFHLDAERRGSQKIVAAPDGAGKKWSEFYDHPRIHVKGGFNDDDVEINIKETEDEYVGYEDPYDGLDLPQHVGGEEGVMIRHAAWGDDVSEIAEAVGVCDHTVTNFLNDRERILRVIAKAKIQPDLFGFDD